MNYYPINPDFLNDLAELKANYKNLLTHELGFQTSRNFFLYQNNHYPIKIKFNINVSDYSKLIIGSFNHQSLCITLNYYYYKFLPKSEQLNLLRHEFGHYLDFIQRGELGQSHDAHYRKLCLSYGWDHQVYAATLNPEIIEKIKAQHKNQIRREKLLALASNNSSWEEAQSALLKAKAIMHHDQITSQDYIAIELIHGKRFTQKFQTIVQLLENFSCKCIVLSTPGQFTLEAITQLSQKDMIIDLFNFLEQQIELWFEESKTHNPRLHRNSFYKGLQKGLEEKIQSQEKQFFSHQQALILSNQEELNSYFNLLYPRTSKTSIRSKHDLKSYFQGKSMGLRLELKNKIQQAYKYLT